MTNFLFCSAAGVCVSGGGQAAPEGGAGRSGAGKPAALPAEGEATHPGAAEACLSRVSLLPHAAAGQRAHAQQGGGELHSEDASRLALDVLAAKHRASSCPKFGDFRIAYD